MSPSRTVTRRVAALAITAVSVYLLIPSLSKTFSSWPELRRLRPGSLLIMAGLIGLSLMCFWYLLGVSLRSRRWGLMATAQLASTAIGGIVPGGAATATAVQFRMLHEAGVERATAVSGLTVATLLNFAVLFALPVLSLPAILTGSPVDAALVNGAVVAAICFVGAAVIGGVFLFWDLPLGALGRTLDVITSRIGWRVVGRPRAERFLEARDLVRSHLADSWSRVALASFGKWGFDYLALVMAVRGVGHNDTSSVLLLAFVTANLLGRIPLTPGGLGFVEAGLAGTLALAGLSAGDAATATLAYRLVTYWLPIPIGALAYGWHRLRMRRTGLDVDPLSARLEAVVAGDEPGIVPP